MTSTKKQVEVKDKIEGDMMDLSFLQLTEVPMKDIASYKKVRELDISTNRLVRLPPAMMTLTHLVKIDLSKNQLKELPENFGDLKKLKHLDLFSNQLKQLPLSFCELRELKFLDLKDNPLVPVLGEAAGDCVDAKSCQLAAKKVVNLMSTLKEEVEKRLRKEKEKMERQEREEQEAEMRLLEQKRREKKAEKERRRNQAKWNRPNEPTASGFEDSGFQEPPVTDNSESLNRVQPRTPTILSRFTPSMHRIVATSLVIFTAVTIARWNGPMTTENAFKNVKKNYEAVRDVIFTLKGYSDGLYAFMSKMVMDLGKKWELDGAISKAQSVWGLVSGKMYDLLNSGYQATLQGFNLCWKQGSEILSRAIEYYRH